MSTRQRPNVKLNEEKLKNFPLRTETKQGWPLPPLLFHMVLEVLAWEIRWEKKKKIQIGKEKVKLFSVVDYMIFYIKNSKDSMKKTVRTYKQIL